MKKGSELSLMSTQRNGPCNTLKQSKTQFYVCVRLRDDWGGDPFMVERINTGGIKDAHKKLKEAIDKYGPTHKVVIEPVQWEVYPEEGERT